MKDNFSGHATLYAKFRPTYPADLYEFILKQVSNRNAAWDCGTGNGQVAQVLARHFLQVSATDISEPQLSKAPKLPNVTYKMEPAEITSFKNESFDLITVAQAIHWFDFNAFYKEVKRTLKPGGLLAVFGYGLARMNESADPIIDHFDKTIIGPYWDKERLYLDEEYRTIPFPFQSIETPQLFIRQTWTADQFLGYLRTWSAVQHYMADKKQDPVDLIQEDIRRAWNGETLQEVRFPVLLRLGR